MMMEDKMITIDKLLISGSDIGVESSLPVLREQNEHRNIEINNLPEVLSSTIGNYCGYRLLPYKLQSHYNREKYNKTIKTIVLENNILKATFLPEYGGRLYSLFNKKLDRELLSVNPVFQPANLGLRNAWFSGGIEWNMAHFGHTYLSSDDVHFALVKDGEKEFVRLYEFERAKGLYYQIDFHLPEDSDHLVTYTKIFNINTTPAPLYYWSNIAVSEMNQARVFSSTDNVIYIKPYFNEQGEMINTFSYGQVPYLDGVEGDVSYPRNFKRSNEYFYQTDKHTKYPWEAVGYKDGFLFYECSTQPLRYRKMFCWGTHQGGTKWQEYLSEENCETYVEIQAGIYPSQLHSETLAANSSVEFMQLFGGGYVENSDKMYDNLEDSSKYVSNHIFAHLEKDELNLLESKLEQASSQPIDKLLHQGHGFGWLEMQRLKKENLEFDIPSMQFVQTDSDKSNYLLSILNNEPLTFDLRHDVVSFMVDKKWMKYFSAYDNEYTHLQIALMYSESLDIKKAIDYLVSNKKDSYSSLYFRTLGAMYHSINSSDLAKEYYNLAYKKMDEMTLPYYKEDFLTEYLSVLNHLQEYNEVWTVFKCHKDLQHEEFLVEVAKAAYNLGEKETLRMLLKMKPSRIREGDTTLVELWYKDKADQQGITLEKAKKEFDAPNNIDFRML